MQRDMENYMEFKLMGSVGKIRMKFRMPSEFVCQQDQIKRGSTCMSTAPLTRNQKTMLMYNLETTEVEDLGVPSTSGTASNLARVDALGPEAGLKQEMCVEVKLERMDEDYEEDATGAECGGAVAACGGAVAECGGSVAECGGAVTACGGAVAACGGAVAERGSAAESEEWFGSAKQPAKREAKKKPSFSPASPATHSLAPHVCRVCSKQFKKSNKLAIHLRTHTGEKPYACDICHKQFSYHNGLKVHLRIHTGEKPYECPTCDMRFVQWSLWKAHERLHTGDTYSCDICHKEFAQLANLKIHAIVHSDIKPYSCAFCQKQFKNSNSLRRHEPVHSDKKPYACGTCNKCFASPLLLRDHGRGHTRGKKKLD